MFHDSSCITHLLGSIIGCGLVLKDHPETTRWPRMPKFTPPLAELDFAQHDRLARWSDPL
jgi:hypothetical protein